MIGGRLDGRIARLNTFRPRMPDKNVLRAFDQLLLKIAEPLGHPGAALTGLFLDGRTFPEEVDAAVGDFNRAVADQEFWEDV